MTANIRKTLIVGLSIPCKLGTLVTEAMAELYADWLVGLYLQTFAFTFRRIIHYIYYPQQ